MFLIKPQQTQPNSIYARLTRLVFIIIVAAFFFLGLLAMFFIRSSMVTELTREQRNTLDRVALEVSVALAAPVDDVSQISRDGTAAEFGAALANAVDVVSLNAVKDALLGDFITLLQQHSGTYLEMRYVALNGTMEARVRALNEIAPDRNEYQGLFANDTTFRSTLSQPPGSVVISALTFMTDPDGQLVTPLRPIFRYSVGVPSVLNSSISAGIIQIDVNAEPILAYVNLPDTPLAALEPGRHLILVDALGRTLADSSAPVETFSARAELGAVADFSQYRGDLNERLNATSENIAFEVSSDDVFSSSSLSIPNALASPWHLLVVDSIAETLLPVTLGALGIVAGFVGVGVVVSGLTLLVLRQWLFQPLDTANTLAQQLTTQADTLPPLPVGAAMDDEVGRLVDAFRQLADRVDTLKTERDDQVARYERNMEIAARISRETATLYDVDALLNHAIDLIVTEFGFYHAQVFLVDEIGLNAVLVYSYGEAGRRMLEKGHKLRIGSESVIGETTLKRQPVVVNDTRGEHVVHAFNPLLPETRAEMAMPLQIGSEVIGALDIQAAEPNIFTDEVLSTFRLLADQVAIAIYKARLLAETESRVAQFDRLNRQLTTNVWEESIKQMGLSATYHYDLLSTARTNEETLEGDIEAPISVRGQMIGALSATAPEGLEFSQNDRTVLRVVADRIALAIENARLFQETQASLAQTSVLYQISRYLNEADTLEEIVQAIVISVMPDAISGQVGVFDEYNPDEKPQWLEIAADWSKVERAEMQVGLPGVQLRLDDFRLLRMLNPNQVLLISDIEHDNRIDDVLRAIFADIGAAAAVLIPFSVRGTWRGVFLIEFAEPRLFGEQESRLYSTLIDQAGVAIENRLLLRQTELALTQIERLYSASRIINTAQSAEDIIRAALATTSDISLDFELATFEGGLDETGWPTQLQVVARSRHGVVHTLNELVDISIAPDSPLRYREPQIVLDRNPHEKDVSALIRFIRRNNNRFGAVFPLFSVNQPFALFFIVSAEPRELSAEDYEVYRALTGQMSTVMQNRRLLEQTEVALNETRRLYDASRAIVSAPDAKAVYAEAARALAQPYPQVSYLSILLSVPVPSADAPYVEYVYLWQQAGLSNAAEVGQRLLRQEAPLGRIIRQTGSGGAIYFSDLSPDPTASKPELNILRRNGAESAVLSPIMSGVKWLGYMVAESRDKDAFDEQYVRFLQAVATQVAIAVDNFNLFREAQLQAQRALALAEAGQLASRVSGTFETSITEVLTRVAEPANYDRALLMLLDEEHERLEMLSGTFPGMTAPLTFDLTDSRHSMVDAVLYDRAILVNEPSLYPAFGGLSRDELDSVGKHLVSPIRIGGAVTGVLMVGRSLDQPDLDESDEQLIGTLSAQIAVALENQRLFREAESDRKTLRSILDTMPAGVLVLDAETYLPLQFNSQAEDLLGRPIALDKPFNVIDYNIYRTGTNLHYPTNEMPIFAGASVAAQVDDVAVVMPNGSQIDLLVNAAPIFDREGHASAIVTAFTDISNLRGLENTLQENLRDTIALYEATRQLAEADETEDVLDIVTMQISSLSPSEGYVLLLNEQGGGLQLARSVSGMAENFPLPDFVLNPRSAVTIADTNRERMLTEFQRSQLTALGVRALVSMPLRARSRRDAPLGWLVIVFNEPRALSTEAERFMTTLNDSAAVALDNRSLLKSTEFALRETAALYDATTSISRSRDLADLGRALQSALETMSADAFAGYLFVETGAGSRADEIFCVSSDGQAAALEHVVTRSADRLEANLYIDDLSAVRLPGALEQELNALGMLKAVALVALEVKGMTKGCLLVGYKMPHHFGDSEARYLNTIADSASVIIDNILLFDQIQSTLEETSVLYQATRALTDVAAPRDVLSAVIDHLIGEEVVLAFVAQLVGSTQWDSPDAFVEIVASWERAEHQPINLTGLTLDSEQFPVWRHLATSDTLMVNDIETDPRLTEPEAAALVSLGIKAASFLPLRSGRRSMGVIVIGSKEARSQSDRDLRVYRAFSEQASLQLEAARLLDQTERRARQLATSAEVSGVASRILDINELLPRIVDLIRDAFNYDHTQIFLMDMDDNFAELRASTGEAGRQLLHINHKLQKGSKSVIGQVTARGEPVVALDTADANVVHKPNPYLPNTRSEMAVPLIIKDRVVGALDVQSNKPNAFDNDDVAVLTTLAGQISVAIDNARLFQESQQRATEMSFLFTVTTAAASSSKLDDALFNVADELVSYLEAESASIYLPRQYIDEKTDDIHTFLEPVALAGVAQPLAELSQVNLADTTNLLAQVALARQSRIINNIDLEPAYIPVDSLARSAVLVPLVSGGQLIGLITMESGLYNAFDQDTLTLLLTLSGTLSAIVQNQQLLERVQQTNEQLRELDRLKSDFLANMSHELRTPLNSIIGFSRVILKGIDGPLTEMQEQDLSTIFNSGQHLLNLINDILDQAKISAGKMDLQLDYFDIKTVIDGVRSIGIGLVKDKPIDIRVELESGLPPAYGDEFRTRQVLLNLVSNASKFTREGLITISAMTTHHPESGAPLLKVSVSDTGIGIAEKDIPLLFEAFRQVDSSLTRTAGGTGLGLPIAKSLIEMQGGEMAVVSQVGMGSIFSITIPTEPQTVPEDEKPKKKPATGSLVTGPLNPSALERRSGNGKDNTPGSKEDTAITSKYATATQEAMQPMLTKRQILIIEENPDMVDQIRRALQGEGFDIYAASIPLEAEAMASGLHPTLIIMDVNFANGAGWNILAKLQSRDDTRDIPVVVNTLSSEQDKIYDVGAFCYIQRPFMPEQIVTAVHEAEKESRIQRILIIDDQQEDVRLMTELLNEYGSFRVFSARDGAEGIAMVARRRPNLVVLDLRLPEMDGFTVAAELRSNPETATIPILVVTGDTLSSEELERLMELDVIYKADISTKAYQRFVDGVKAHLARVNGD